MTMHLQLVSWSRSVWVRFAMAGPLALPTVAVACSCASPMQILTELESEGFARWSSDTKVFHAKVSHFTDHRQVEVVVKEVFRGAVTPRLTLTGTGHVLMCGGQFRPDEEYVYFTGGQDLITGCSKLDPTKVTLERLRRISSATKFPVTAAASDVASRCSSLDRAIHAERTMGRLRLDGSDLAREMQRSQKRATALMRKRSRLGC